MSAHLSVISHSPLEAPLPPDITGTYLDYWPAHLEADRRLTGAMDLARLSVAGSVYVRDPERLTKVPPLVPAGKRDAYNIIKTWDRGLGSFNHMVEGTGDLLRGAAMLLRDNQIRGSTAFPPVRGEPAGVLEAFLDVADQLDIERQIPGPSLLLAGQLVHKAAWVEEGREGGQDLFSVAGRLYDRIYSDNDVRWNGDKLKAGAYLADIEFHGLSRQIRSAHRQRKDVSRYKESAVGLLRRQIGDLFRAGDLALRSDNERTLRELTGEMLELFAAIVIRDHVYVRTPLKGDHCEVRTAFTSEDEPYEPRERSFEGAFDLVIDRVAGNDGVVSSTPVQLKLGDNGRVRERGYDPAIAVVTIINVGSIKMSEAGRLLLERYADNRPSRNAWALSQVQPAVQPLLAGSKAA